MFTSEKDRKFNWQLNWKVLTQTWFSSPKNVNDIQPPKRKNQYLEGEEISNLIVCNISCKNMFKMQIWYPRTTTTNAKTGHRIVQESLSSWRLNIIFDQTLRMWRSSFLFSRRRRRCCGFKVNFFFLFHFNPFGSDCSKSGKK